MKPDLPPHRQRQQRPRQDTSDPSPSWDAPIIIVVVGVEHRTSANSSAGISEPTGGAVASIDINAVPTPRWQNPWSSDQEPPSRPSRVEPRDRSSPTEPRDDRQAPASEERL